MASPDKSYVYVTEDVPTYTLNQAADVLGVSKSTVKNLASKGLITVQEIVSVHSTTKITHFYTVESVLALKKARNDVITVSDLAKKYGKSNQLIFNILAREKIEVTINNDLFLRPTGVLTMEAAEKVGVIINKYIHAPANTRRKSDFYREGYGLLQVFTSPEGINIRARFNDDYSELGLYEGLNNFTPIKSALNNGYKPLYTINTMPSYRSGYVTIQANINDTVLHELIDLMYMKLGYRNMYLKQDGDQVQLFIKATNLKLEEPSLLTDEWIQKVCIYGTASIDNSILDVKPPETNGQAIDSFNLEKLADLSKSLGLSVNETVSLLLENYSKSNLK